MRRVAAALCMACLLALGSVASAAARDTLPKVYLALGNSLAYGVGATAPERLGYVPHLYRSLRGLADVDQLVNVSVPGSTSTDLIQGGQLANALAVINDPATDVAVVTLDIGGNDLAQLVFPGGACYLDQGPVCQAAAAAALSQFVVNYNTILSQLAAALAADPGEEVVLVMTYYNYLSGLGAPFDAQYGLVTQSLLGADGVVDCAANAMNPALVGLNDIITCYAGPYGVTVVDVYPLFVGKADTLTHMLDSEGPDFHPTNAGHTIIASALREGLKAARR